MVYTHRYVINNKKNNIFGQEVIYGQFLKRILFVFD